ncbi:MAG: DUF1924 domain-containing protein [Candidatus Contendobacter sp.]|nr:MAG: DUF1924 domain-containing protein [Candidatus Contendobacter sp.]
MSGLFCFVFRALFFKKEWNCATCHGCPPSAVGQRVSMGKIIIPL